MAKVIKNMHVLIESNADSPTYNKVTLSYIVCSSDDTSLQNQRQKVMELDADDLAHAVSLFNAAKAEAESDEGI